MEDYLRVRVGQENIHYGSGIAAGAFVLQLFGDLGGAMSVRLDGDGGLLVAYEMVELLGPVYAGDVLHVKGKLLKVGNTSRKYSFECLKLLTQHDVGEHGSSGDVLDPPELIARAVGTIVVKREKQRRDHVIEAS